MSDTHTLLGESKSLCSDYVCPNCRVPEHVTAERVLIGNVTLTVCHCRACGHSWHPHIDPETI